MSFLKRLLGKKRDQTVPRESELPTQGEAESSIKRVFGSPSMLAEWIVQYVVKSSSVEDDFDRAPDEDARQRLNITFAQVERLAREQGLLRAVGVAFFVKKFYDNSFYLKFLSLLYRPVAEHMYGDPTSEQVADTRETLELYVNAINDPNDEDMKAFQRTYLQRIYDDNDNYIKLLIGGVGSLAIGTSFDIYEIMRNEYFKATQGISHESYKLITEALDKVEKGDNA